MFHVEHCRPSETDLSMNYRTSIKWLGSSKVCKISAIIWIDLHNKLPFRNLSRRTSSQNAGNSYQNSFCCNPTLPYIYLKTRQLMPSTGGRRFNISADTGTERAVFTGSSSQWHSNKTSASSSPNSKQSGILSALCFTDVSRGTFTRDRAQSISSGNYQKNVPGNILRHVFIGFYRGELCLILFQDYCCLIQLFLIVFTFIGYEGSAFSDERQAPA